jgi:hypothetical protein
VGKVLEAREHEAIGSMRSSAQRPRGSELVHQIDKGLRPSIEPIADQREAHNAAIPNSQITDSPYFHPHSLWSDCPGASWVSSIGNGYCRLGAELNVSVSGDVVPGACRSHPNSAIWSRSAIGTKDGVFGNYTGTVRYDGYFVESRMGASTDAEAPPRFPSPLIKPDVRIMWPPELCGALRAMPFESVAR